MLGQFTFYPEGSLSQTLQLYLTVRNSKNHMEPQFAVPVMEWDAASSFIQRGFLKRIVKPRALPLQLRQLRTASTAESCGRCHGSMLTNATFGLSSRLIGVM